MEIFKQEKDIQKTSENEIFSIENKEIPEQKYIDICEKIGKNFEFKKQICKSFDTNLKEGLIKNGIDFQSIFKKNNLSIENLV